MFGLRKGKKAGNAGERIQSLSAQGLAGPELISELRNEGFKPGEVDRGFRDVLKRTAVPELPRPAPPAGAAARWEPEGLGLPPAPGLGPPRERVFREEEPEPAGARAETLPGLPPMPSRPRAFGGGAQLAPEDLKEDELVDIDDLEEPGWGAGAPGTLPARPRGVGPSPGMAEARLDRMDGDLEEIQERIERMEGRLHVIEQRVPTDLEKRESEAMQRVTDEQKRALGEVSLRMEALEKVMKDSLGPMLQTMRSLSDTVKAMKGPRE